jgi:predicted alpha/beta-fold hydrolase
MPFIQGNFKGNLFSKNGHWETIMPALFRKIELPYRRERFTLPDGDFLDLDLLDQSNEDAPIMVLFHGLEGSSNSQYIKGFSKRFQQLGMRCVAVNFRSCSGTMNKHLISYHSGATDDIHTILHHFANQFKNSSLFALGFSLGGNALLKYLGDGLKQLPTQLKAACCISVPIDLAGSSMQLSKFTNQLYMRQFLKSLNEKMKLKAQLFPNSIDTTGIDKITNFWEWDNRFTAKINGFKNAEDYYNQCNALQFLEQLNVPTLLLNALNDPFLSEKCFPEKLAKQHPLFTFEQCQYGGHVGFASAFPNGYYWHEERAIAFMNEHQQG